LPITADRCRPDLRIRDGTRWPQAIKQAIYPVSTMCRVLGVSTSGFYAWLHRGQSATAADDARLVDRIRRIHGRSSGTYGAPRIQAGLASEGVHVGRKRVARLMRENGLAGVSRRKGPQTTTRSQRERPAPDLVDRDFAVDAPDRLWVGDISAP
jgi:transposase InsO family protein